MSYSIYKYVALFSFICANAFSRNYVIDLSLPDIINVYSLNSPAARIEYINYHNEVLDYLNYKKSFLPTLTFSLNPISFNRSLRLLQSPEDGSYSYVEDYSNTSTLGLSIRQKVGFTGGDINIGTNLSFLNEFSSQRKSFSTIPFYVNYSQQLWGSRKMLRIENKIRKMESVLSVKKYCSKIAEIQLQSVNLYFEVLAGKLAADHALNNMNINDTLLQIGKVKLDNGYITEYDYKQIELQAVNTQYAYRKYLKTYDEAMRNLKSYLAIDDYDSVFIRELEFELPEILDETFVKSLVYQNNPFLLDEERKKLDAERVLFSVNMETRFNGNISLNYGINQYAGNFTDAYRNANTQQSLVIGFQIPMLQWGINRNKRRIASNNYKASLLAAESDKRKFDDDISKYTNAYNHAVWLWKLSEKSYLLSCEQYLLSVKNFELGEISVYELISARQKQDEALQQYYSAMKETYVSYFRLRNMSLYDFRLSCNLEDTLLKMNDS